MRLKVSILLLAFFCFAGFAHAQKISDMTPLAAAPASGDQLEINDVSGPATRSITVANLFTTPVNTTHFDFGATGVRVTNDADGAITFLGLGNGSDEDFTLNLDDTANTVVISSSTGVTTFDFGSIGITTSGTFSAGTGSVTTFRILDNVDQSHGLQIVVASDLTDNRALTITTGDAARSITLSGNPTLSDWFDQSVKAAASPQFTGIELSHASANTLTASGGVLSVEGVAVAMVAGNIGAATATSPAVSDNDTSVATTAFVQGERAIVTKSTATNYTIGTTDSRELYGGVIYVTGAATLTVPAVAAGASFTVITVGAVAVSVDPNASDLIVLDGTALSDGDKVTNTSTTGDIAVFTYYDGTGWYCTSNSWTDGN
jgi:hypothetical protein